MIQKILFPASFSPPPTELYLGEDLLNSTLIPPLCTGKIIVIADAKVQDLYGAPLAERLQGELLILPSGEQEKTDHNQQFLQNALFKLGCGRDTTLIAVGGGVTTDLVGFLASIYLRGIPLILVPTTLLAMVDASIGGKTAINTPFGKNLIGTFYPPKAIVADLATLKTLPKEEMLNGQAEILKMGLIFDASLFDFTLTQELILKAIQAKMHIVQQDPKEQSLRRILNFGHTIGHGLEKISQFEMPHGKAVALGSVVEAHLSMQLGYLSAQDFEKIHTLYTPFSLQLPSSYTRSSLLQALSYDKKKAENRVRCVLIDKIGHALEFNGHYCREISEKELSPTLLWMEKTYG